MFHAPRISTWRRGEPVNFQARRDCEHGLFGGRVRLALGKIERTLLEQGRQRFLGLWPAHPLHELLAFTLDSRFELAYRRLLEEPLARQQRAAIVSTRLRDWLLRDQVDTCFENAKRCCLV